MPDDIIIAFTPSISLGELTTSQYIRKDPATPLAMDEIDIMIEKIEKISLSEAREKAKSEYAIIHDDIRLISSTLTSVTIDGEGTDDPIGSTGEHIKITVLNVYTIASEYNMLRSIVSSLHKSTISLVPTTLLFPKLLDRSDYAKDSSLVIDLGHTHMTLISLER
jgi:cell division ATPase FtsA